MRWQTLFEARWILLVLVLFGAGCWMINPWLALPWALLILFTFSFFRDPERPVPVDPAAVVAAADGRVVEIEEMEEDEVLKARTRRVAIFLSVFDVHTNRAPLAGRVMFSERKVGKFLDARNPECSRLNERWTWAFQGERATLVARQITGAIARRIVAWSRVGDRVEKGERFGMIRFGSRTEIYLPLDAEITVRVGDRVKGGETIIARLKG